MNSNLNNSNQFNAELDVLAYRNEAARERGNMIRSFFHALFGKNKAQEQAGKDAASAACQAA